MHSRKIQDFTLERDSSRKGFPTKMGDRTTGTRRGDDQKRECCATPRHMCARTRTARAKKARSRYTVDMPRAEY